MKFTIAIASLAVSANAHLLHFGGANGLWRDEAFIQTQDGPLDPPAAIVPPNYDPWVYEFSRENMNPFARQGLQQRMKQHTISSRKMDDEVRAMALEASPLEI